MSIQIRKRRHRTVPVLNMASMPDLIFTVLFFFMIVTHMRTESVKVHVTVPEGKELNKATNKRTVTNLYIGTDRNGNTRIQIGERIVPLDRVGSAILAISNSLSDEDRDLYTVNIKADRDTPMGIVTDVKQELRKAGALNIRYSASESGSKKNY